MKRSVLAHQLYQTTRCELLVHEKNSALGMLWHLLSPLGLTLVLFVVFSEVAGFASVPYYPLFILTGIIQFQFFQNATTRAANGMLGSRDLVLNSTMSLEVVVLRSVLVEGLTYAIEIALVALAVLAFGPRGLTLNALYFIPVVVSLFALTIGVALALSAMVVFLSDLTYVWSLFMRMLFFLTPIFYSVDIIDHPRARQAVGLNPLTLITDAGREALLYGRAPSGIPLMLGGSLVVLLLGWLVFRRLRPAIADFI